jgi:hypothetical protein
VAVNSAINYTGCAAVSIAVNVGNGTERRRAKLWPLLRKYPRL